MELVQHPIATEPFGRIPLMEHPIETGLSLKTFRAAVEQWHAAQAALRRALGDPNLEAVRRAAYAVRAAAAQSKRVIRAEFRPDQIPVYLESAIEAVAGTAGEIAQAIGNQPEPNSSTASRDGPFNPRLNRESSRRGFTPGGAVLDMMRGMRPKIEWIANELGFFSGASYVWFHEDGAVRGAGLEFFKYYDSGSDYDSDYEDYE